MQADLGWSGQMTTAAQLGIDNDAQAASSQPCGLTIAELEAYKAQLSADAAHAQRQKTIHLILAAVGGYFLCKMMR